MTRNINVLIDTFPGLSPHSTICLPLPADSSLTDLWTAVYSSLHPNISDQTPLLLSSPSRTFIYPTPTQTLADLISRTPTGQNDHLPDILTLRLSAPLVGGKGGFGSQLRAAGGRMSSRKRKQNAELATGSARNLDGRRLRTITEAKNLAAYLATKPDMERKEKEERRKRWEQVVELAEQREADMRSGKGVDGRRKGLSEEWIEEKEEVADSVKNAVKKAMRVELGEDVSRSSGSAGRGSSDSDKSNDKGSTGDSSDDASDAEMDGAEEPMELDQDDMARLRLEAEEGDADALWVLKNRLKIPDELLPKVTKQERRFAGFDEDDEDDSDDVGDEDDHPNGVDKTAEHET